MLVNAALSLIFDLNMKITLSTVPVSVYLNLWLLRLTVSFLQVTVRSLGWIELQEESLTSENSSKAVNRCIVQLSSAADSTEILDRCVKNELARKFYLS